MYVIQICLPARTVFVGQMATAIVMIFTNTISNAVKDKGHAS